MIEYEILRAFEKPDCPICTIIKSSVDTYLEWFLIEYYYQPHLLIALSEGGFCRYHAPKIALIAQSRLSFPYEFVTRSLASKIERVVSSLNKDEKSWVNTFFPFKAIRNFQLRKRLAILERRQPCPICKVIIANEDYSANVLVKLLTDPANWKLYQFSQGLCWEHLLKALSLASPQITKLLLKDYYHRLTELNNDFQEYFRKMDYRFAAEAKGTEQNAWQRTINMIEGSLY